MKPKSNSLLKVFLPGLLLGVMAWPLASYADKTWTLKATVQRVLGVAPEYQASQQLIGLRQTDQQQAKLWPNPEFEIRVDEKLGLEDGSGGYDVSELVFSQAIPINRMQPQIKQADALLSVSQSQNKQQQLWLEYQASMLFHELQLKLAKYNLSQQRLALANQFKPSSKTSAGSPDSLVRYVSPLDQKRLAIMRESARQARAAAEGELHETMAHFRILLHLGPDQVPQLSQLKLKTSRLMLEQLKIKLNDHPSLMSAKHVMAVAQAETEVAKASRYKDPTVNLFFERDNFIAQNETYTGISVNMEIPLWNSNQQAVSQARAGLIRSKADYEVKQRELNAGLQQSFVHYQHLFKQAEDYQRSLLKPAEQLFRINRKSFAAGEQNILGLIDANNTYFDIKTGYLKLLAETSQELAKLRLAAGIFINGVQMTEQGESK